MECSAFSTVPPVPSGTEAGLAIRAVWSIQVPVKAGGLGSVPHPVNCSVRTVEKHPVMASQGLLRLLDAETCRLSGDREFTLAELFCGCGGLSRGFSKSGMFRVVLGNDIKPMALETFTHNFSQSQIPPEVLEGDIRGIPIEKIEAALGRQGVRREELDCLVGGPPCQGFSQARRSEEQSEDGLVRFKGYDKLNEDPRNDLVVRFLDVARALRPKVVLIENVPQMLTHAYREVVGGLALNIKAALDDMGYEVSSRVINAADYGVPQLRERSFIIGSRIGRISFPEPSHAGPEKVELIEKGLSPWNTVRDALLDLPARVGRTESLGGMSTNWYQRTELSDYAQSLRSERCFPYGHLTRAYRGRVIDIIRSMNPGETWDSASERMRQEYGVRIAERMKAESDGDWDWEAARASLVQEGAINPAFYKRYYWSAYTRLSWDRPALTITANCNFLGSGRFTHPEEDRGITMREAARLQSFDDDFRFITSEDRAKVSIGVGMDMIGEAVPPMVGEVFARRIGEALAEEHKMNGLRT